MHVVWSTHLSAGGRGARGIDVLVGLHVRERVIEARHRAAHELLVEHLRRVKEKGK
jgi:hypothetical protein